ncbi:hypothetical protein ALC56_05056 [Trachymyrmex septentrionalis]|uniref:Uncharacterized protein n=1 Tax=Trachymyrmex septentrionalis TaxID=34720 RepID=A0A195FJA6_9HYME|nr:hypothetical protein ALC56_05056 [Trachymyrmex septentrionalis]
MELHVLTTIAAKLCCLVNLSHDDNTALSNADMTSPSAGLAPAAHLRRCTALEMRFCCCSRASHTRDCKFDNFAAFFRNSSMKDIFVQPMISCLLKLKSLKTDPGYLGALLRQSSNLFPSPSAFQSAIQRTPLRKDRA